MVDFNPLPKVLKQGTVNKLIFTASICPQVKLHSLLVLKRVLLNIGTSYWRFGPIFMFAGSSGTCSWFLFQYSVFRFLLSQIEALVFIHDHLERLRNTECRSFFLMQLYTFDN